MSSHGQEILQEVTQHAAKIGKPVPDLMLLMFLLATVPCPGCVALRQMSPAQRATDQESVDAANTECGKFHDNLIALRNGVKDYLVSVGMLESADFILPMVYNT